MLFQFRPDVKSDPLFRAWFETSSVRDGMSSVEAETLTAETCSTFEIPRNGDLLLDLDVLQQFSSAATLKTYYLALRHLKESRSVKSPATE